jgi:hypothetical protein
MMRSISNELSRRARFLAKRDGYDHEMFDGSKTTKVLKAPGMVIYLDEDNTLSIVHELYLSGSAREQILLEGPIGTLIETSEDEVLEWAINQLVPLMVLDDLASI